ncbi:hypothetical protein ETU08_00155 [Apibacter muscae]|uniref:hypothetical protein n=1 Tax=Apibacter muscae TaxID=2509004 RepID=UPI0011ACA749|nr:hypothetical protein [Apibacter muscae]TWP31906.1 hypothetical protein ETU08_00155 [Apibacter muscae]
MEIYSKYYIGEIVYLKCDNEQKEHYIVRIIVLPNNLIMYELRGECQQNEYFEFEITNKKDTLKAIL